MADGCIGLTRLDEAALCGLCAYDSLARGICPGVYSTERWQRLAGKDALALRCGTSACGRWKSRV